MRYAGIIGLETYEVAQRLHSIDEKDPRLACPGGQKISMPAGIDDIYVDIPENRLSLTVIETIQSDAFSPTSADVIIPANKIVES